MIRFDRRNACTRLIPCTIVGLRANTINWIERCRRHFDLQLLARKGVRGAETHRRFASKFYKEGSHAVACRRRYTDACQELFVTACAFAPTGRNAYAMI